MELILLYILVQNILEDIVIWLVALSFLIKNIYMKSMNLVKSFLGATMSPMNAWLALRGLRTLPVRLKSQEQSVKQVIQFLQQSLYVKKIYHPMVHTSTDLTDKYLKGYGSLLSFVLKMQPQMLLKDLLIL